jgi:hypothetical protein
VISASEARKISEDVSSNELKSQLEDIERRIKIAADKGNSSCYINTPHKSVKERLELLGYTIKSTHDQRDGDFHTVSW